VSDPNLSVDHLQELLLSETPFIDVRAPVEFAQGSLPGAVNLPIMNDDERAQVGTTYKKRGSDAAIKLGHSLVSGAVKDERVHAWLAQVKSRPETVLYCFRGGLRSQTAQGWLREAGVPRPLIVGGYKASRNFLIDVTNQYAESKESIVISGPTGSAKTSLIKRAGKFYPAIDLEGLAQHRGSAFGAMTPSQPAQAMFENLLAAELLKAGQMFGATGLRPLFEDESRLIGRSVIPENLFANIRRAKVFYVQESFEQRVQNIFSDYITTSAIGVGTESEGLAVFERYKASTRAISRRLGGVRTEEVLQDLATAEQEYLSGQGLESNREWIGKLLKYYYDPLYTDSFQRRQPEIEFRGSGEEILEHLKSVRR
jgi:tRNA 2-selenouridine synthase